MVVEGDVNTNWCRLSSLHYPFAADRPWCPRSDSFGLIDVKPRTISLPSESVRRWQFDSGCGKLQLISTLFPFHASVYLPLEQEGHQNDSPVNK